MIRTVIVDHREISQNSGRQRRPHRHVKYGTGTGIYQLQYWTIEMPVDEGRYFPNSRHPATIAIEKEFYTETTEGKCDCLDSMTRVSNQSINLYTHPYQG